MRTDGGAPQTRSGRTQDWTRAVEVAGPRRAARDLPYPDRERGRARSARGVHPRVDDATLRGRAEAAERGATSVGRAACDSPGETFRARASTGIRLERFELVEAG